MRNSFILDTCTYLRVIQLWSFSPHTLLLMSCDTETLYFNFPIPSKSLTSLHMWTTFLMALTASHQIPWSFLQASNFLSNIFTPVTALVPHSQLLAWCLRPILFNSIKLCSYGVFYYFIYLCLNHTSPLVYSANFACILVFSTKTSAQLTMPLENYTRITM